MDSHHLLGSERLSPKAEIEPQILKRLCIPISTLFREYFNLRNSVNLRSNLTVLALQLRNPGRLDFHDKCESLDSQR